MKKILSALGVLFVFMFLVAQTQPGLMTTSGFATKTDLQNASNALLSLSGGTVNGNLVVNNIYDSNSLTVGSVISNLGELWQAANIRLFGGAGITMSNGDLTEIGILRFNETPARGVTGITNIVVPENDYLPTALAVHSAVTNLSNVLSASSLQTSRYWTSNWNFATNISLSGATISSIYFAKGVVSRVGLDFYFEFNISFAITVASADFNVLISGITFTNVANAKQPLICVDAGALYHPAYVDDASNIRVIGSAADNFWIQGKVLLNQMPYIPGAY